MKVHVHIRLKDGVLDTQGEAIRSALGGLGFDGVNDVRAGKLLEIDMAEGEASEEAIARVTAMCDKLLANPVIEDYSIRVGDDRAA